jgi:hypothetical protein
MPLPALSPMQTRSFASLCGFASALRCDVLVHFVPAGEKELVRWMTRQMYVFGTDAAIKNEETLWEQFLRRVGLNAFAACQILTELKKPESLSVVQLDEEGEREERKYGLVAFVGMTAEDRVNRFARVMGGRRVLERVGRCLGGSWELGRDEHVWWAGEQ